MQNQGAISSTQPLSVIRPERSHTLFMFVNGDATGVQGLETMRPLWCCSHAGKLQALGEKLGFLILGRQAAAHLDDAHQHQAAHRHAAGRASRLRWTQSSSILFMCLTSQSPVFLVTPWRTAISVLLKVPSCLQNK